MKTQGSSIPGWLTGLTLAVQIMLAASISANTITWTNLTGGDWNTAANWNPNQVPGPADDAIISLNGNYTVTINNFTAGNITLGGAGSQPTLAWNNSTLANGRTLTVVANSTLTLNGSSTLSGSVNNSGAMLWLATAYGISLGAPFNNLPGAVFEIRNDGQSLNNQGGSIINSGTFRKSQGSGNTSINVPFDNSGTVAVQTGTLSLNSVSGGGVFSSGSTATLSFNNGGTLDSGTQITGAGSVQFNNGTFTFNGLLNVANPVFQSGTFILNGTLGPLSKAQASAYNETLGGSVPWEDTGSWSWNNVTLAASASLMVDPGASLSLNGSSTFSGAVNNSGTINWLPSAYSISLGSTLSLQPGAVFDCQNAGQSISQAGGGSIANAGSFKKSAGTGNTPINVPLINSGTVAAQVGTLSLGTVNGGGLFSVESSATLSFNNGGTLDSGTQITGAGGVQFNNGTFNFNGLLNVASPVFQSGTFILNGTLGPLGKAQASAYNETLGGSTPWEDTGSWSWNSVSLAASASLMVDHGASLNLNGSTTFSGAVNNSGTINWLPSAYSISLGSTLSILPGAVFDCQNAGQSISQAGGGSIANAGSFKKSAGTGNSPINVPLINSGTVAAQVGTLSLGTVNGGGLFSVESSATLSFNNGGTLDSGTQITGAGSVQFNNGTFTFNGLLNIANPVFQSGTFILNGTLGPLSKAQASAYNETLGGSVPWEDTGSWSWNNVTLAASASLMVDPGASLSLNGSSTFSGPVNNSGTINWLPSAYSISLGSTLSILPGAVFNCQNAGQSLSQAGGGSIANAGSFEKSAGTGNTPINVPLINSGTVAAQVGTLSLGNVNGGGLFSVESSATLTFNNGGTLGGGTQITGAGSVQFNNGTFNFGGLLDVASPVFQSGTFNLNGTLGPLSKAQASAYNETLGGSVPWEDTGSWSWNNVTLAASASLMVDPGASLSLNGSTTFSGAVNNSGTINWLPSAYSISLGSTLSILPGAVFDCQNAGQSISQAGGGSIANAGSFKKSAGTGNTPINVPLINSGTVDAQVGTLGLNTVNGGGLFSAETGATLSFNDAGTLDNNGQITGAGNVQFNNTFTLNGILNAANTTLQNGAFNLNGTLGVLSSAQLTVVNETLAGTTPWVDHGNWSWNNVSLAAPASLTVASNATLNLNGSTTFSGVVTNAGTVIWLPSAYSIYIGAPFYNQPGGLFDGRNDGQGLNNQGAGSLFNAGTLRKSAGSGSTPINLFIANSGVIDAQAGTFILSGSNDLTNGTINFGISGPASYGQITLQANPSTLGGKFSASLNGGYVPAINASFQLLNYPAYSGSFSRTNLPTVGLWQTAYNPGNVSIKLLKYVPVLTWTNPPDIVYGTLLGSTQLNATAASPTNPSGNLAGTFTYNPPAGTALYSSNNQTLSVTFTPADSAAYTNASARVTLNVQKAPLAIVAGDRSKTYGQTVIFAGTEFAAIGLKFSDTVTGVNLTSPGASASAQVAGSPFAILPSAAAGAALVNYILTYTNGHLTVNPASVTITASPQTKTYGQTLLFGSGSTLFNASGLQNGETIGTVTLAVGNNGGLPTAPVAGSTYAIMPSSATGGTFNTTNYTLAYAPGSLTINRAPLTVTAAAQSKVYGQTLVFGGGSTLFNANGLQNGETIGTVTLAVSGNGGAATSTVAGSPYTITPSAVTGGNFSANNYTINYAVGNLNVTRAPATVSARNRTKMYGQLVLFVGTEFDASGLLNGDLITSVALASSGAAANATLNGSPYGIIPSGAVGGRVDNYTFNYVNGVLTLTVPTLNLVSPRPNLVLSWTTNANAFVLNQTASLKPPIAWTPVTSGISVNGTNYTTTISDGNGTQFFRLIAP